MIRAVSVDASVDLRPFIQLMREQGLRCQVSEESGRQVVWTASDTEAERIAALLDAWQAGYVQPNATPSAGGGAEPEVVKRALETGLHVVWRAPVTISTIALCLLVALISQLGTDLEPVRFLFFPAFEVSGFDQFLAMLGQIDGVGTALRTLTPALLHFGVLHLVFNLLWLWVLGRLIESVIPPAYYLFLILFTAFWGNVVQYLWSLQVNFGGMSGVVYGLIGFIWIWQTLRPHSPLGLPPAMIAVFLVALVLMEVVASGFIATAAHVGGLVSGMVAALLVSINTKQKV